MSFLFYKEIGDYTLIHSHARFILVHALKRKMGVMKVDKCHTINVIRKVNMFKIDKSTCYLMWMHESQSERMKIDDSALEPIRVQLVHQFD